MTLPSAVAEHGTVEERFTQTEKEPALPHRANPPGRAVANLRRKRIWTVYLEVRCPLLQGDLALIPHDDRDFGPVPAGEAGLGDLLFASFGRRQGNGLACLRCC